jgi:hypothetical protein
MYTISMPKHSFVGVLEGDTWYCFEPQIGESIRNKGCPDVWTTKWRIYYTPNSWTDYTADNFSHYAKECNYVLAF